MHGIHEAEDGPDGEGYEKGASAPESVRAQADVRTRIANCAGLCYRGATVAIGSEAVSDQLREKVKPLIVRPKRPVGRKYLRHARDWGVGWIQS